MNRNKFPLSLYPFLANAQPAVQALAWNDQVHAEFTEVLEKVLTEQDSLLVGDVCSYLGTILDPNFK